MASYLLPAINYHRALAPRVAGLLQACCDACRVLLNTLSSLPPRMSLPPTVQVSEPRLPYCSVRKGMLAGDVRASCPSHDLLFNPRP
jgi:hypothetical protein